MDKNTVQPQLFPQDDVSARPVRITLTARQFVPQMTGGLEMVSLFQKVDQDNRFEQDGHADPEEYPEEMNTAVQDMLDRDAGLSEFEIYEAGCEDDDGADGDTPAAEENDADGIIVHSLEELWEKIQEIQDAMERDKEDDDKDLLVFRTLGTMRRMHAEDGHEILEITYQEDASMEDTSTILRYDPEKPGSVIIYHEGSVQSLLICERGKRHVTAYRTPLAPFEVAVYTKKCDAAFSFERGGSVEMDYIIEIRGAEMQRTIMTIDAVAL